jgi:TPP-dependent indolepyruvate ferredoxin oxidoreductase alpha subunit
MHGEQEGLYQNCEIHNPRGSSFAPRARPNMMCSVCSHLNIFNFLIATAPILFKFDMMHYWDKGDINCEFQVSCPPGAFGAGQKVSKLTNF